MASESGGSVFRSRSRAALVKVLGTTPLFLALVFYLGPRIISEWEAYFGYGSAPVYDVPSSVLHQFRLFDIDGNGFLDPYEFERLSQQFVLGVQEGFHSENEFVS